MFRYFFRFKKIHQTTRISYRVVDEFWDPKSPDLETLKVSREIPMIVVALSRDPIPGSTQQTKNHLETFLNVTSVWQHKPQQHRNRRSSGQKNPAEAHRTKKSKVKETKEGDAGGSNDSVRF